MSYFGVGTVLAIVVVSSTFPLTTMNTSLSCPHCAESIDLESTLVQQVKEQVAAQNNRQYAEQRSQLEQREAALATKQQQLQQQAVAQQAEVQRLLSNERADLRRQLKSQLEAEKGQEVAQLTAELQEKTTSIAALKQQELDLRREQRKLQEQRDSLKIEAEKQLQLERRAIEEKALQKARDENHLKTEEQQGLIQALTGQIAAMKQKIEQGSQQTQGEAQEVALERLLTDAFPRDLIEEVGKGTNGADVIQTVTGEFGQLCGRIIYESKRTKAFTPAWIVKLKGDLQAHKGDIAVLVTEAMPRGYLQFGLHDGVWVCSFQEVRALATALRQGVLRVADVQTTQQNQGEKMQVLYKYLTSNEFRQCMEGIVQTFQAMQQGLEKEKRATKRQWAEREKLIEAVIDNSACMYGSMRAIAGGAVAQIDGFELESEESPLLH